MCTESKSPHHLHDDGRLLLTIMRLASPIPHKRARIEIIPLIDIMFFLLASFMMVSLSQTHMKGIKVALPAPSTVPPPPVKDYVSIRVGAGNAVSFDGQFVQDEEIMSRLYRLHEANPNIKISISAEGMARHGDVITVLDKVRRAGIQKVGYQIRAAQGGPAAGPGAPGAPGAAPPPPPPPPH
jgi:biopolymer transport protein ExbD